MAIKRIIINKGDFIGFKASSYEMWDLNLFKEDLEE